jgi:hypothetical protein
MKKSSPASSPLHSRHFFLHFSRNLLLGFSITLVVLAIGMAGYRYFEKMEWLEAYVNSAMVISGVGSLTNPQTDDGKFFVGTYSLVGSAAFIIVVAVVFSPIFHWLFRQVHVDDREHFK